MADIERLNSAVDQSIVIHKYLGDYLPTKRSRGLDWTLGEDAVRLGQKTGYDYALFLHAEDQVASSGRVALGILGFAGCFIGFCAPNVGGATQLDYASLVDLKTGEVVWFNVVQASSQLPGIKFGDLRTPAGAQQMVERLLGRMKPGQAVRRQPRRTSADVRALPRNQPPGAADRRRRRGCRAWHRHRRRPASSPGTWSR